MLRYLWFPLIAWLFAVIFVVGRKLEALLSSTPGRWPGRISWCLIASHLVSGAFLQVVAAGVVLST
jgi:hypothetical protein